MENSVIILAVGVAVAVLAAIFVLVLLRGERGRAESAAQMAQLADTAGRLAAQQAELTGRLQQTQSGINERLDGLSKRLGDGLAEQTEKTGETLKDLQTRLAVIDRAQQNITDLSQQVVGLQDILSNKQARGAFGEIQLQDIVTAALPPSAFALQVTLGNGARVDCLLNLPNPPGAIAIDAKFPLESYQALRDARDEAAQVQARRAFSADVLKHVRDIADKYIVPGETAESALMFLPSEAVYAELHANFRNVIEDSFRRRVWIVSPTTLMATLNTVRAILKDARMREQAGVIQTEVQKLLKDVGLLTKRVDNLGSHFRLANKDIEEITTSAGKIERRAERIDEIQLGPDSPAADLPPPVPLAIADDGAER
ncbi:DNA recombination protein RmuC [Shumkonia mesophila]|uniref:DNA recombination protein RmuC n=1 Tax=Shumkonia mesophila TaxID=2838854 RepID=UPI0029347A9F|nr:DNA recombination protein RmuC [Shumkonia mesophila]